MQRAKWNGTKITAFDIPHDSALEDRIRVASKDKCLRCLDEECSQPILRYCHGDVKIPYFAHLSEAQCDYALYDKSCNEISRLIQKELYEHLQKKNIPVTVEEKRLPHHYTPIIIEPENYHPVAIEFICSLKSAEKIPDMVARYKDYGYSVQWLFVMNDNQSRYDGVFEQWDEKTDFFEVDSDLSVHQTRKLTKFSDNFMLSGKLTDLTLENGVLTLSSFNKKLAEWERLLQHEYDAKMTRLQRERDERQRREREAEKQRKDAEVMRKKQEEEKQRQLEIVKQEKLKLRIAEEEQAIDNTTEQLVYYLRNKGNRICGSDGMLIVSTADDEELVIVIQSPHIQKKAKNQYENQQNIFLGGREEFEDDKLLKHEWKTHRTLLFISLSGDHIVQYIRNDQKYMYMGTDVSTKEDKYCEITGSLYDLVVTDAILQIDGADRKFQEWLKTKNAIHEEKTIKALRK